MTCHRYDKCDFIQNKNFYNGIEVVHWKYNCIASGKDCEAAQLSDIEFKVFERELGENIWKFKGGDFK